MAYHNIDIKDEFIKELKEELRIKQTELEGNRYLIKRIGSTLRKAWEDHREGETYPGFNDEDIGWVFDSLEELEQLRHYVNCPHHRKCILPDYCDPDCQNCYALITFKEDE